MKIAVDSDLAYRLESAEGMSNADLVEAQAKLFPEVGACWESVAGAFLMFDGVGSEISQSFGLGIQKLPTEDQWDQIESFFLDRGTAVNHEVCPLANPELLGSLHDRGYRPIEWSTVLFKTLEDQSVVGSGNIEVRLAEPEESELWTETAVEGWSQYAEFKELIAEFCGMNFSRKQSYCFFGLIDSIPIATGSLIVQGNTALLAGASTIPSARQRGAQNAILNTRLQFAQDLGCDIAMVVAAPGSSSQKNAQRNGFDIAYSRTKWQKPAVQDG